MALQITLVKAPGKVSVSRTTHIFNEQGGSLGRGESNTWVLPDPEKFLSSCHCQILCEANSYYIVDTSTNGTFLNGSPEPIGKGVKTLLGDGHYFELGEYRFSVKYTQGVTAASPFDVASTPAVDDIFGSMGAGSPFADPFASSPSSLLSDISLSPDLENNDPLAALDKVSRRADADIFGGSTLRERVSDIQNPQPFSNSYATDSGGSSLDFSPSMDQHISWPDSSQENLIPDDWEDDLLGSSPALRPSPFGADPRPVQAPAKIIEPTVQPTPATQRPIVNPEVIQPQPFASEVPISPQVPVVPQAITPQAIPPVTVAVPPVAKAVAPTATVNSSGVDHRLITAMGLDASRLSDEQIQDIHEMTGELMREIVDGMMQILRSRTSIKNEFRMNVTTIQPIENNPLKFSVGVDEALENMFIKKSNAYKKPIDAFREGFQEIGEHQVAMIAGIRHGFERMMERFNPEILEKNFNKQGKGGVIPGMQKAKYWSNYGEYYKGFVDNMESSFQHLFGSDFVHAYENQLRKLSALRKKNK